MPVKQSRSGSRILAAFEQIARCQPIGISDLARVLQADKSAVQRAVATLAAEGWIQAAPGRPARWQPTGHVHLVAYQAQGGGLFRRARPALEALRDQTGETVGLTVPDIGRFVVVEVVESRQMLRAAPHIGMVVETHDSASGRAVLPYLPAERQAALLGRPPDAGLLADFAATLEQGYFVSENDMIGGSINVAAPIFEVDARPVGAVILSAPRDRLPPEQYERFGGMVAATARLLSRAEPPSPRRERAAGPAMRVQA